MKNRRNMNDSSFKHFNPMALRDKYSSGKVNNHSNFWFDDSPTTSIFDEDVEVKRGVNHIQLASYRIPFPLWHYLQITYKIKYYLDLFLWTSLPQI